MFYREYIYACVGLSCYVCLVNKPTISLSVDVFLIELAAHKAKLASSFVLRFVIAMELVGCNTILARE